MSRQNLVGESTQPTFVGDTFPAAAYEGDTFLHTLTNPKSIYTFWQGEWKFQAWLRPLADRSPGTAGYIYGGVGESGSRTATDIEKLAFSDDSITLMGTTLSGSGAWQGSAAQSLQSAYCTGSGGRTTNVLKLSFSDLSSANITSTLPNTLDATATIQGDFTKGYFCKGRIAAGVYVSATERITFSSEVLATTSASTRNVTGAGWFSSSVSGYNLGGRPQGTTAATGAIDKMQFSSESWSSVTSALGYNRYTMASLTSGNNFGYVAGGVSSAVFNQYIERLSFTSEARSILASNISPARTSVGASSYIKGYILSGWFSGAPPFYSTSCEALDFSSESVSVMSSQVGKGEGMITATDYKVA